MKQSYEQKSKEERILDLLHHEGAAYRGNGIAFCIAERLNTTEISKALKELKGDHIKVLGRPISSYAIAALDIIGAEQYTGEDEDIKSLISGLPLAFH